TIPPKRFMGEEPEAYSQRRIRLLGNLPRVSDLTRDLTKLIEAVNRVGIQNISLLSRMTGMPTETIRYTMKKRFPKMGLKVGSPLNHSALGLERYFVSMRMTQTAAQSESSILKALSSNAF